MGTITVSNLGKAYKQYPNRWARLLDWLSPSHKTRHSLKWVLQDVSFQIGAGESVGIIGVNGAGKSTLLKMITGTTQPTTGRVEVSGRVAALLELGMGFHPDFTGRQNVFMAGQLQGLTVDEIHELMPEIESFAAIGDYIDQPVRIYSSGMQVRLAFAVATAKRADVLIVDEALSVGDAAFQRKCFQRIESFRSEGTTLLFVSHDIETVKKLCDRAVLLKDGFLANVGPAKQICDEYERHIFGATPLAQKSDSDESPPPVGSAKFDPSMVVSCENIYGNGKANIVTCMLTDADGRRVNVVESGHAFKWSYRVLFEEDVHSPIFAMMIKTVEGISVYGVDSTHLKVDTGHFNAGDTTEVEFLLSNFLAPGVYYLNCGIRVHGADGVEFLSRRVDSAIVKVIPQQSSTAAVGIVDLSACLSFR